MSLALNRALRNFKTNKAILSMEKTELILMKTFGLGDKRKVLSSMFLSPMKSLIRVVLL